MITPESPSAQYWLWAVLAGLMLNLITRTIRRDRSQYRRFKRLRSTRRRQRVYREWLVSSILTIGLPALVVIVATWQYIPLLLDDVNAWPWVRFLRNTFMDAGQLGITAVALIAAIIVVGAFAVLFLVRDTDTVPSVGDIQALLPRNRAELRFGVALSINAGISEELLFRLALPTLLFAVSGNAALAIVLSVLLFGALHLYQGKAGVIGSTIVGTVLMALYLATGTILVPIVAHILIDLRSLVAIPMVVFQVHRGGTRPRTVPLVDTAKPARPKAADEPAQPTTPSGDPL
ncbi:CPBP family intramembrane glutamic endopeptidase [Marisediminicola senii]|uniref:CPBP family intramembrane glutamic endopeptidase n=1 Tax=Marisediminicola senii TaxID=2711233 RepID=UPI0013EC2431|nr:type II CAAX endopeptidase family protein [Marisediminicola senii]